LATRPARFKDRTVTPSPLDQLTDPQKTCLRLVFAHHNSKEIALLLGISPSAVDKRIERAVQLLSAPSRFAAARLLAESEEGTYERLTWQAFDGSPKHLVVDEDGGDRPGDEGRAYDRLPSDPIDLSASLASVPISATGQPRGLVRKLLGWTPTTDEGKPRNPLSKTQRLVVICGLVLFVALITVALLNMGSTLTSILAR